MGRRMTRGIALRALMPRAVRGSSAANAQKWLAFRAHGRRRYRHDAPSSPASNLRLFCGDIFGHRLAYSFQALCPRGLAARLLFNSAFPGRVSVLSAGACRRQRLLQKARWLYKWTSQITFCFRTRRAVCASYQKRANLQRRRWT